MRPEEGGKALAVGQRRTARPVADHNEVVHLGRLGDGRADDAAPAQNQRLIWGRVDEVVEDGGAQAGVALRVVPRQVQVVAAEEEVVVVDVLEGHHGGGQAALAADPPGGAVHGEEAADLDVLQLAPVQRLAPHCRVVRGNLLLLRLKLSPIGNRSCCFFTTGRLEDGGD